MSNTILSVIRDQWRGINEKPPITVENPFSLDGFVNGTLDDGVHVLEIPGHRFPSTQQSDFTAYGRPVSCPTPAHNHSVSRCFALVLRGDTFSITDLSQAYILAKRPTQRLDGVKTWHLSGTDVFDNPWNGSHAKFPHSYLVRGTKIPGFDFQGMGTLHLNLETYYPRHPRRFHVLSSQSNPPPTAG